MKQRWLCYDDYWSKEKVNVYSIDNRERCLCTGPKRK